MSGKRPEKYRGSTPEGLGRVSVRYRVDLPFTPMSPARLPHVPPSPRWVRADGTKGAGDVMESGPAIFAGVVFALFGGALLVWTGTRVRRGEPVAQGVSQVASATLAGAVAVVSLGLGAYCLTRL